MTLLAEAHAMNTLELARNLVPSGRDRPIDTCGKCGRKYTGPEWARLRLRDCPNGAYSQELNLEFRDCATPKCGNTMAAETKEEP